MATTLTAVNSPPDPSRYSFLPRQRAARPCRGDEEAKTVASADPYETLGVKRDASQKDIQKSYRRLAKKLHPDLNPGNKKAEADFKNVAAAYDLLSDPEKRARFDRGEIDASGAERPQQRYYRDFAGEHASAGPYASDEGFADFADADDLFEILRRRAGAGRARGPARGADVRYHLAIDFLDAVNGATKRLTLPDGSTLDVTIPPGTRDGQVLRLRGKGGPGGGESAPAGDALIEIEVRPHPFFKRDGDDIHLDLPVTLREAVLGERVTVPTPTGPVSMRVPKGANTGTTLRLRGKGVARRDGSRGDEYARLEVMLPPDPNPDLERFIADWPGGTSYNPRGALGG
jgi:DnaJ-class molecular chaperone